MMVKLKKQQKNWLNEYQNEKQNIWKTANE